MRWESLRDQHDEPALFERTDVAPAPSAWARGTGRAGLADPGPEPVLGGDGGDAVAVEIRARSVINRVPGEAAVPFRWTVNPYRGCSHACVYCFARRTHEYLDLDSGHDFDSKIMVKVNAGELLRRELADPRWAGEPIAMGTNTDPYQRAEGRYRLMPQIIAALRDFANPFSVLTKGRLILRDLDLLEQAARVTDVGLAVSVGSLDEAVWRSAEPGTPRPASRLDVVRRCADRGLDCSVLMAPILPGLTDSAEQIEATVAAIAESGAANVTPILLHLRPGAREWYMQWLAREHPQLVPRYRELYRRGAYAPKPYRDLVGGRVREAARRHGLLRPGSDDTPRHRPAPAAGSAPAVSDGGSARGGEQLTLLQ
ncbi:Rv2578c family radical SAM protein [Streptomonospora wellingtoniae]|uniref:Rv2578c family radical SAM protein n=1 Tax=Streptomonospora wellingtoniae TaxID=3075544 RepID=A0ABU2KNC0_9ACTN|nr:Rv2578c family radical SAM protein [Streptomonospora sp. DSM 45055]MDT0300766.1 Rv2578c family radical SAM protein [Streptomonospora sp. DSM 45055]